jgi:hypothetical protein
MEFILNIFTITIAILFAIPVIGAVALYLENRS